MSSIRLSDRGFTLIELMLAMAIFSTVMVVTTAGFIGINRTYTRGTIKKELAEAAQRATVKATTVLRSNQQSGNFPKTSNAQWEILCSSGARFYWSSVAVDAKGMYVDTKPCSDPIVTSDGVQIVDSRYKVEDFDIKAVSGVQDVYEVSGIIRTPDEAAFTVGSGNDSLPSPYSPEDMRCKGSSAGLIVTTCAIEKFNTLVNARGQAGA